MFVHIRLYIWTSLCHRDWLRWSEEEVRKKRALWSLVISIFRLDLIRAVAVESVQAWVWLISLEGDYPSFRYCSAHHRCEWQWMERWNRVHWRTIHEIDLNRSIGNVHHLFRWRPTRLQLSDSRNEIQINDRWIFDFLFPTDRWTRWRWN